MNNQKIYTKYNSPPIYDHSKWTTNYYILNSHNYAIDNLDNNIINTYNQKIYKKCNSTPIYNPSKWTNNFYVQNSHNCYAYALDDLDINIAKTCKKIYSKKKNMCFLASKTWSI